MNDDLVDFIFVFKQKTAYEMRISDWSSDVCSSDLNRCLFVSGSPAIVQPFLRIRQPVTGSNGRYRSRSGPALVSYCIVVAMLCRFERRGRDRGGTGVAPQGAQWPSTVQTWRGS